MSEIQNRIYSFYSLYIVCLIDARMLFRGFVFIFRFGCKCESVLRMFVKLIKPRLTYMDSSNMRKVMPFSEIHNGTNQLDI